MATIAERINKAKQDNRKVNGKGTAAQSIEERIRMAKQDSAPVMGGTHSAPSGAAGTTSPVKGEEGATATPRNNTQGAVGKQSKEDEIRERIPGFESRYDDRKTEGQGEVESFLGAALDHTKDMFGYMGEKIGDFLFGDEYAKETEQINEEAKRRYEALVASDAPLSVKRESGKTVIEELNGLKTELDSLQQRMSQLEAEYQRNPSAAVAAQYEQAVSQYNQKVEAHNALYAEYEPQFTAYNNALGAYNTYVTEHGDRIAVPAEDEYSPYRNALDALDSEIAKLNGRSNEITKMMAGLTRAAGYGSGEALAAKRKELGDELAAIKVQLVPLEARRDELAEAGGYLGDGDFLGRAGYSMERLAAAALGMGENITDFAGTTFYGALEGVTSLGGLAPNAVSEWAGNAYDEFAGNSITRDYEQSIRKRYKPTPEQEKVTGFGQTVAQVMMPIAAGKIIGALSAAGSLAPAGTLGAANAEAVSAAATKGLFGASAAGGATGEAHAAGASHAQSLAYGWCIGAMEMVIEEISGTIPGLPDGTKAANVVKNIFSDPRVHAVVSSPVVSRLIGGLGESGEEALSAIFTPYIKRAIYDPNAALASIEEIKEQAIVGGLASLCIGAGIDIPAYVAASIYERNRLAADEFDAETIQAIIETGLESPMDTNSYKLATALKQKQDAGKSLTAREIMSLYQENVVQVDKENAEQNAKNTASGVETAVNENGLTALTEQEKTNLSSGKKNKVISTFNEAVGFIKNALSNKQSVDRAYLGKVPDGVAKRVLEETGVDITGYNAILPSDAVRHMFKNHGNETTETARGQVALTAETAANITTVLSNPDKVYLSDKTDARGLPALIFEKQIGDYYITAQAVSDGTHSIQTDTLYVQKKKNPQDTVSDASVSTAPEHNARSVPPQGSSTNNTIPHTADSVNSGVAQGFGKNGAKVISEIAQNSGTTIQQAQEKARLAYQIGRSNLPGTQLDLTDIDQRRAYNAGKMDFLTADRSGGKDLVNGQETRYTEMEGAQSNEEVHLRGGSQRADGEDSAGSGRKLEESAGRDQSREEAGNRPADTEAASLTLGEKVDPRSFGIARATNKRKVRPVVKGMTEAMKRANAYCKARGLSVVFFAGDYLDLKDVGLVHAYISGDRVFVRIDDPEFACDQIVKHEIGHDKIAKGEISVADVRNRLDERYTAEEKDRICEIYLSAFAGTNLDPDEVWVELICDAQGDMNIFAQEDGGMAEYWAGVLEGVKASTVERKANQIRGPTTEAKASRAKWYPDLTRGQLEKLRQWVQHDIKTSTNSICDTANWTFRNFDGLPVFAIYSTMNESDPTILYEVKGEQATFERDILKDYLEDIEHGKSVDEKPIAIDEVLGRSWMREAGSNVDGNRAVGRERGTGDAGVLRKQPGRKPSAAFESVLRNLFKKAEESGGVTSETSRVLTSRESAREAYDNLVAQCQEMTPAQIVRLTEQDADTTPALARPEPSGINTDTGKESKLYSSAEKSENVADETWGLIQSVDDIKYYRGISNMDTLNQASERLATNGQAETLRFATLDPKEATAVDVAEGFILLKRYQDKGDYESAVTVLSKLREIGTTSGQAVQSFSLLGRLTPEGMAVYAQRELDQARKEMVRKKSEEWVDKRRAQFELTPEEVQFIMDTMERAAELPEGRDKNILIAQIATMIEDKIPTTILKQIKGFTRNAMLLNSDTMTRNVVGNAIMMPVYVVQDFIAAGVDASIAKRTGVRTTGTTLPNRAGLRAAKRGVYESFDDFRREVNTRQTTGDRFEVGGGSSFKRYSLEEIQEAGRARRMAMELSNALNKVDRVTGWLLDMGDRPFFEYHFTNSLNNQLRLNQTTRPTAEMIDIATTEALQRTWQDENVCTKAAMALRNTLNGGKDWGVGSAIVPFVKTPANLTKALLEYSPLGLVGVLKNRAGIYTRSKKSKNFDPRTQKAFVDALSKSITGTLVMALGRLLTDIDLISGGDDEEDKDLAAFKQNVMGIAPYSVKIGGKSYTYDWAQPVGGLFAISADYATNVRNGNEPRVVGLDILGDTGKAIMNALAAGGNVLFEQSFLQGLSDLFKEDNFMSGVVSALSGASGQFVPTALSQIAQIADPYARTSFAYRDIPRTTVNKVIAKIPGLRSTLPAVVDVLGHDVLSYGGDNSVWNVFFNPANVYSETATKAAQEIYRVYEETGDTTIIPRKAPYYLEYKGERYNFTGEERADYQRAMGGTNEQVVGQLLSSQAYQSLDDEDKAAVLHEITNYSAATAKKKFLAGEKTAYEMENWMKEAQGGKSVGLSEGNYIVAYQTIKGIEGLKDRNSGDTITNSKSLLVMEAVYKIPGLTDEQRKYLFECFDVGKTVIHWNKALVQEKLKAMRKKAA